MDRDELLALLSTYLDLQPTYRRDELKTLCPFHAETHPSLYINTEKLIYHCFGCGKAGTVLSLLKDLGVQLSSGSTATASVFEVLMTAHEFFRQQLKEHPNAKTVASILLRRNRERFIETFQLGYAPAEKDALLNALNRFFSPELLRESGLFSDSLYPLLLNRITIPLRDESGRIVAFAGRAISNDQKPKFINTRNTALFQKRAFLAFAHEASQLLPKSKLLLVVEGYFDAMHFLANRLPAVCVMSTNLTLAQATLLKRLHAQHRRFHKDPEIVFVFDSDNAGIEAVATNIAMLSTLLPPISLRLVLLPTGRDPDELAIHTFLTFKRFDPISGFVEAVCRGKPSPERVARALLVFPDDMRKTVSRMLEERRHILGTTYLQLVFQFFGSLLSRTTRRPPSKPVGFDLYSIAAAMIIQGKLTTDQLGELIDEFPEPLKRLLITPLEQLSRAEQEHYAKLAFMPCSLMPDEILRALLKASVKRKLLQILGRIENANSDELLQLSKEFDQALADFQSLDQF